MFPKKRILLCPDITEALWPHTQNADPVSTLLGGDNDFSEFASEQLFPKRTCAGDYRAELGRRIWKKRRRRNAAHHRRGRHHFFSTKTIIMCIFLSFRRINTQRCIDSDIYYLLRTIVCEPAGGENLISEEVWELKQQLAIS